MARRPARRGAAAASVLCLLLGLAGARLAAAQAQQGAALQKIQQELQPAGWAAVNPSADACADPGTNTPGVLCEGSTITALDLKGKSLKGTIPNDPQVWISFPGLKIIDFTDNPGLSGTVPDALASAPQLYSIKLYNTGVTGDVPASLSGKVEGISAAAPAGAANATAGANSTAGGSPSPAPSDSAAAPDAAATISDAPICACALQGVASKDCLKALDAKCGEESATQEVKDACGNVSKATTNSDAAATLAQFLANECFVGQGMTASPCVCFQDPNSNDCAKARLNLCINKDKMCVPFQMPGSDPASVAGYAASNCPVPLPDQSGVQVNMTFAKLTLSQWTPQLTQNIGNAIAASGNVSTSSVELVDVRPVAAAGSRRRLLQSGASGIQAVYFAASADPDTVNTKLQLAASDGSFAKSLSSYGVPYQPSVALKTFYGPPPAASGFPLWAIAPIVVGALVLLGLVGLGIWLSKRSKRSRHAEFAPAPLGVSPSKKASPTPSPSKPVAPAGSAAPKDYHSSKPYEAVPISAAAAPPQLQPAAAPRAAEAPAAAAAAAAAPVAAAAAAAAAAPRAAGSPAAAPAEARSVRVPSGGSLAGAAGPAAEPAAPAPIRTSSRGALSAGGAAAPALAAAEPAAAPADAGAPALSQQQSWKTNVRPAAPAGGSAGGAAAGAAAAAAAAAGGSAGGAVASMTSGAKGSQQAARAQFWAQFQETWQQVRETKRLKEDGDPGTPSSGTNWTETTGGK